MVSLSHSKLSDKCKTTKNQVLLWIRMFVVIQEK